MPIPYPAVADAPWSIASTLADAVPRSDLRARVAACLPRLALHVSYRSQQAIDAQLFDGSNDSSRWWVPYGFTVEAQLVWSFDRLASPPTLGIVQAPLDLDPDADEVERDLAEDAP